VARIALRWPEVVDKLVIMNAPHPFAFRDHLTSSLSQLGKSWYIFYFQLPYVPEEKIRSYVPLLCAMPLQ
jgi:hypothetical protein